MPAAGEAQIGLPDLAPCVRPSRERGVVIGADYVARLQPDERASVEDDLTVQLPVAPGDDEAVTVAFARVDGDCVCMPRFYGLHRFGVPDEPLPLGEPLHADCVFKGELLEQTRQKDVCDAILQSWTDADMRRHGVRVTLPCGFGKTVVAINAVTRYKRRALVVAPNTVLVEQWRERFAHFCPGAHIRTLRGSVGTQRDSAWVALGQRADELRLYDRTQVCTYSVADFVAGRVVRPRGLVLSVAIVSRDSKRPRDETSRCVDGPDREIHCGAGTIAIAADRRSYALRGPANGDVSETAKVRLRVVLRTTQPIATAVDTPEGALLSFTRPVTGADVRNNCGVRSPCPQLLTAHGTVDVVVATVQTIAVVEHDPRIFASFGVLVVDEVHSVCGRVFSNALRCAPCSRILALSATPERRDGLHAALPWLAGEEVARVRRTWERVDVDALSYKDGPHVTLKLYNGQLNLAAMINKLCADDQRTARIAAVVHAHRSRGRCVLVLSERVEHLQSLRAALSAMGLTKTGLLVGATPSAERSVQSAFPVLFATYPMCKQGFDKPELDTLVMATPITSLEQVVGRILRAHPAKRQPLVVDVVDPFSIFAGEARKRQRYYTEQRYQVKAGSL